MAVLKSRLNLSNTNKKPLGKGALKVPINNSFKQKGYTMKNLLPVVMVTCLVSACNSEQSEPAQQKKVTAPDAKPQVDPLKDMKSAYYGYQIVESRVWINGVVGLLVEIE